MNEYCKIKICIFFSSSFIKTVVPCLLNCMKNKSSILLHNFYHHHDQLYLHYITIIWNMTLLFKSVRFNCLSICHSAIICMLIIWLPKYMRNRTLVSKWLSKDRNVMSSVSTAFKVHYNQKLGETHSAILGWTHQGLWGDRRPCQLDHCMEGPMFNNNCRTGECRTWNTNILSSTSTHA